MNDVPEKHPPEPPYYNDLGGSLSHVWDLLARGVADRRSPFRTPALGTISPGGEPEVRTVVLRAASRDDWCLHLHTDRRSAKHESLINDPRVALHIYDANSKIQLRLSGTAVVNHGNEVARTAWLKALPMSRECYAQTPEPGRKLTLPDSATITRTGGDALGFDNFVVVVVQLASIEWLYLAAKGHRRAIFERNSLGAIASTWLAP